MDSRPRLRNTVLAILLAAALLAPVTVAAKPDPGVSGVLSIVPGLGQVANGDTLEGLGWFASTALLFISPSPYISNVGLKFWEYNMYDAFNDAGPHEGSKNNAFENYIAFINPLNLVDPYSVGIVGLSTLTSLTTSGADKAKLGPTSPVAGAFFFGFTGWGEEGLFRGFLYPGFSSMFGSHFAGATASSLLFAASHLPNKQAYYHSVRGLGTLFVLGMVWCAQASYRDHDLRHNIFSHAWFDIIQEYAGSRASDTGNIFPALGLNMTVPF